MSEVEIVSVETAGQMKEFVDLPWRIYAGDPNWVPPLKKVVRHMLDKDSHPFWRFSERLLLLAKRGNETVGRIAGIIDGNYNDFHRTGMGIWGFFECFDDRDAADALFSRVEEWLRKKGMTFLRGPLNPSTNYEIGMLYEGYEHPPTFMMPYNPRYYHDLVESAGFRKEKDLQSYYVDRSWQPPEWMMKLGEKVMQRGDVTIRHARFETLEKDVKLIKNIYDQCWNKNWGYVPMTDGEVEELTKELARFADPELVFFIYVKDEPVSVGMSVPDINPLLKRLNGKIGLLGAIKFLLYRKEIRGMRGLIFGIKEEYRQLGLPFVGLQYLFRVADRTDKYNYLELGWNLEDNDAINVLEKEGGARPFKKYRIYGKSFADRW
jgi:hypothetical protein